MRFTLRACYAVLFAVMAMVMLPAFTEVCVAQNSDLVLPGQIFNFPAGARAPGMGSAFSAIADDSSAAVWNPAGLTQLKKKSFTFMQLKQSVVESTFTNPPQYNFLNMTYPVSSKSTLALSYLEVSTGGIENWQVTDYDPDEPAAGDPCIAAGNCEDLNPGVEDTGTNNADIFDDKVDLLGNFDDKETAIVVSYAQDVMENLSVGANLKFFTHKIGPFSDPVSLAVRKPVFTSFTAKASAVAADIGALYKFTKLPKGIDSLNLGVMLVDTLPLKLKWNTGANESSKLGLRAGIAAKLLQDKLTLAVDYDKRTENGFRYGAEYWLNPKIGLRLGDDDGNFTVGASLRIASESIKNFQIDYAYLQNNQKIANSNLIAVTVGF